MNPDKTAYLRGLEKELNDNSNSIRLELNRFEQAGLISATKAGNKKLYSVNREYPLFSEIQSLAMKHFGIDRVLENVIRKLGQPQAVYLVGDLAEGHDSNLIDLVIVAEEIDRVYLAKLVQKAEKTINRKIRTMVLSNDERSQLPSPSVLIYSLK